MGIFSRPIEKATRSLRAILQTRKFYKYPKNIVKGLMKKERWAFSEAARWDIEHNQISPFQLDILENHSATAFNSYHLLKITEFYYENAKKEREGNIGETEKAWKQCSPAMYYAMNKLYNWSGKKKIKSGYVEDYKDPKSGKITKGIVTLMKEKKLIASEKKFVAIDEDGKAGHYSKKEVVKMDASVAAWAKGKTARNGVGIFLVSALGGYHSLTLIVDLRGKDAVFSLLDQHGNSGTGSKSTFDRMSEHSRKEIDEYFVEMAKSWGNINKNHTFRLFELKRNKED
jgi:hypothetical protein